MKTAKGKNSSGTSSKTSSRNSSKNSKTKPAAKRARSKAAESKRTPSRVHVASASRPKKPVVSVIMVTHRCKELAMHCLESLRDDGYSRSLSSPRGTREVIVVDSGSGDGTPRRLAEKFADVTVIARPDNVGVSRGNNLGLEIARGDYLLLLSPDTELPKGAVASLVAYLERHPNAAAVGPRLLDADGAPQVAPQRFPSLRAEFARHWTPIAKPLGVENPSLHEPSTSGPVDWIPGSCMLLRRTAFQQVGFLDEGYFLYFEETDWCRRARCAGWEIHYDPSVSVVHTGGKIAEVADEGVVPERRRGTFATSRRRYFRKHHGPTTAFLIDAIHALSSFAKTAKLNLGTAHGGA